jgi:GNAT superfamily N-acetyltransferase
VAIRPYVAADETNVLELLGAALGGGPAGRRPPEFFRWKHFENRFGPSLLLVAEADGRVIGLRAFMRWRFQAGEETLQAVRAVDTATHPAYQGMGVFSRLTREALEALAGQADLVFNTPNGASRPGYLKLGWEDVGRVPVAVRPLRPLRLLRGRSGSAGLPPRPAVTAEPAAQVLQLGDDVARLLTEAEPGDGRLHTPRDLSYLRWRYGAAPLLDYAAVVEEQAGRLGGLAIFRVRPRGALWESTVSELLVPAGDRAMARRLLRRVVTAAAVDHLTVRPAGSTHVAAGALRVGCLPAPGGISFVVRPLRTGLRPDPTDLGAWALALGDLEVF